MSLFDNKPFAFSAMAKPIGSVCNLNCTYCYYLEKQKLYPGNQRMSDELLEKFIRQYIQVQQIPVINFVWQGGEPTLLGLDFFNKVVELQDKHASGKKIENSFQTNGTLLNDDWCRFFKKNNFLIGISIDGPEEIHDRHRPFKTGAASWEKVMTGVNLLRKHGVDFNTLTVIHNDNVKYPLEIYRFLKRIGSGFIQFIPIIERIKTTATDDELKLVGSEANHNAVVSEWSVKPEEYGDFLNAIFDEWVLNDVGKVYVQQFDASLASWVGQNPGICIFSRTCGDAVVLEHNGDVYSCDHFVYPEYKLGNIKDKTLFGMLQSDQQTQFGTNKLELLPKYCLNCEYRFACHGECPKHRFEYTPNGEYGLNYLCKAYKRFFSYAQPAMDFMVNELKHNRPPANVMNWIKK